MRTGIIQTKHPVSVRRIASFLLIFAMLLCLFPRLQFDTEAASLSQAESKLAELESQLNAAKSQRSEATGAYKSALSAYNKTKSNLDNALAVKAALDSEISAMESEIEETYSLIDEYNVQINDCTAQIATKQAEIEEKYDGFKDRIRLNYEDSYVSYLALVFSSDSFSDLLSRVDIVASMMDYDSRIMEELDAARQELDGMKTQLEGLQVSASQKLSSLEETIPQLEEKKQENEAMLVDLQKLYSDAASQYGDATGAKKAADSEYSSLAAKYAAAEAEVANIIASQQQQSKDEAYVGGTFRWPVDYSYRTVSSGFGYRSDPFGGSGTYWHNGIDIPCSYGANVYAAGSGKVTIATYHYSYGNYVVIDHGGGYSTLYAHNSSLSVSVGQSVSTGTVIAHAGATGSATGNHCHFSVIINGTFTNPMGYVNQP